MVIGLAGLGWFLATPHAEATVDDQRIKSTGEVKISAAPGLGYAYQWRVPGGQQPEGFSPKREITLTLQPGESKEIVLEVQNAFKSVARETIPVSRPPATVSPASCGCTLITGRGSSAIQRI